jgi:hypothetical protein
MIPTHSRAPGPKQSTLPRRRRLNLIGRLRGPVFVVQHQRRRRDCGHLIGPGRRRATGAAGQSGRPIGRGLIGPVDAARGQLSLMVGSVGGVCIKGRDGGCGRSRLAPLGRGHGGRQQVVGMVGGRRRDRHLMIMVRMMMVQMVRLLYLLQGGRRGDRVLVAGAVIGMVEALAKIVAALLVRGPFRFVPVILEPVVVFAVFVCLLD